jgi:hypothetical protein
MLKSALLTALLSGSFLIAAATAEAVSLPDDTIDRAIACSVYGGFAPNGDPGTVPTKRVIDRIVEDAVRSGQRTEKQVSDLFSDTAQLAMDSEPREELIANWRECRESFAPDEFRS